MKRNELQNSLNAASEGMLRSVTAEPRTPSRSGFASDKEGSNTPFSNRRPSEKGGWTSPSAGVSALGKARSPGVGARQTFRTNSLDNVGSSREKLIYKEDDEARFNFSGRFPGAQQPNRTTSLDSPATGQRRDWDDPAPKNGPRLDWSAGGRRDAGGVRVRPNSARAGSAWVSPASLPQEQPRLLSWTWKSMQ